MHKIEDPVLRIGVASLVCRKFKVISIVVDFELVSIILLSILLIIFHFEFTFIC